MTDDAEQWIAEYFRGSFVRRLRWRMKYTKSLVFLGLVVGLALGLWLMPLLGGR